MSSIDQTSIKVRDYMARSPAALRPEQSVEEAARIMIKNGFSGMPVTNDDGMLIGIVSEHDCIRALLECTYHEQVGVCGLVRDSMRTEVDTVNIDDDIIEVSQRIIKEHKRRYPVLDDGRLVGQISRRDLMRALVEASTANTRAGT